MTDVILDVSHIAKTFGHVQALKDITLSLRKGRVHTLLGENGAGKSTLMKILAGVYPPTQGTITLRGETITINNPQHSRQLGIAIIFQELSLSNNMTVAENIYANNEPRRFGIINDKKMLADCQNLLAELGIPLDPLEMVGNMSMAHRQLVEIAKALSYAADVVIMDEPTSSLSDNEAEILFNIIEKLKQRGCAVIYISHRMDEIMRISDDISVIRDGEYIATHEKKNSDIQHLIAQMVGREMKNIWPARLGEIPDENVPAKLEVKNLSHPSLFKEISFAVRPGEVLGFFGLVGAGRSDVMKALFGLVSYQGTVLIDGKEVRIANPKQAIDHGIAFVTENRKEEGLVLMHDVNMNTHHVAFQYNASRMGLINHRQEEAKTLQSIARMNTKVSSVHQAVGALSGGNQQKAIIAREVEQDSSLMIFVQPTRGLDIGAIENIHKQIIAERDKGKAILLISLELDEIMNCADTIAVIYNGSIQKIAKASELTTNEVGEFMMGVKNKEKEA